MNLYLKMLILVPILAFISQSFAMQNTGQLSQAQQRALILMNQVVPTYEPQSLEANPTFSIFNRKRKEFAENIYDASNKKIGEFSVYKAIKDKEEQFYGYLKLNGRIVSDCEWCYGVSNEDVVIQCLHVVPTLRENGYGTQLALYVGKYCKSTGIKKMGWIVSPFDLRKNETKQSMLPKLKEFYKKLGAQFGYQDEDLTMASIELK